ncbi:T9SS-dependent choice-of-anchor J family protein [Winogradskyella luteola]|uniref:Choice-of-anchor J domain-containing protein n=1 Tax=Winogradskyella luteola TaxID=2828330 RepID=A0A9X1FAX4_9FLAO|nr:choice-of-anchor J domain-containing protein [Winogradskyella luteola]MBV7269255.1 choice-of-anchor J domain-containing protein [Winogradskyella luteola]
MKKNLLNLAFIIISLFGFGQSTLYFEDFTGQAGKGARGPGGNNPTIDLSGVNWSIDVNNVNLTDTNDFFFVRTVGVNDLLEGRDLDGEAIWLSPPIDITGFTNVSFTIDVSESNGTTTNNLESDDTVTIEYRIDTGAWTTASTNGTFSNDYSPTEASENGLNGSTLELRVTMLNNGGGERQRIDNIEVTGFPDCTTAFSLPFNEGFEGSFPPDCWTTYRGTNGLGTNNDWTSTTSATNSGTRSAFVEFEVVSGGNAQDWLVTPAIDLATAQAQLRFFAQDQFTIDYNTEYTVRISQTSATDISSFTTVQTYNETQLGNPFNEKTIDLSAYTGIVYIAFVMEQNDGDNWFLDDVSVVDISACPTPTDITNLTANYIDGTIDLQWALGDCYDDVLIIGKEGSTVTTVPTGDGSTYVSSSVFGSGTETTTDEFAILNNTDSSVSVSNVIFGNTYHFEVFTRKGTTWSTGVPISITLNYCTVDGDTTFGTSITLVDFGSINNITAQGSGYDDFTSQSTSIARGDSEDLTVNLNTDGNFAVYSYAWIDWNQDGDFNDSGETYDLGETIDNPDGATSNSPLTITVPDNAELGSTRLRILSQYYFNNIPTNGPCDGSTDGEIEDYTINVLPGTIYTYDNGWSPSNPNGVSTTADDIIIANGDATITSNISCNTLTVNPGAGLTVNSGVVLTALDEVVLQSTSTSYASLILDGTITGNVIYLRHVNNAPEPGASTTNNDLISAPLIGQSFGDFRIANPNILSGTIGGNPAFLFGPFNPTSGNYVNYQPSDDTEVLDAGEGFRTGSTDNSTYRFIGTVETGTVSIPIVSGGTSNWNLIGNPYPSYLNVQGFLNNANNASLLDENAVGIYGYDGAADDGWTIFNLATTTPSTVITPGQGFFIDAENSGSINFTASMRSTGNSDDFIVGRNSNPLVYLKLSINTNSENYRTAFYFNDNASTDLDLGYDASVWNSVPEDFSLHSYLVENDNDIAMAIQALHSYDLQNITIPLGVNSNASETLEFSILESTIPDGINIYLEDTVSETITLLNNESYTITPNTDLNGSKGRFYLRFVNQSLSVNETNLENLQIFANQKQRIITIKGTFLNPTKLRLYDLQGRLVKTADLAKNTSSQNIDVSNLSSGIFIVDIKTENARKVQKVILR